MGISEQDFQMLRSKSEIQSLFSKIGTNFKVGKFNAIYNRAKELQKSDSDQVSVRSFMIAIQQMQHHDEWAQVKDKTSKKVIKVACYDLMRAI